MTKKTTAEQFMEAAGVSIPVAVTKDKEAAFEYGAKLTLSKFLQPRMIGGKMWRPALVEVDPERPDWRIGDENGEHICFFPFEPKENGNAD